VVGLVISWLTVKKMHTSKKAGRPREEMKNFPSEQRAQMINVIRELAAQFCSKEDAARVVGTSATTFKRRLREDPEMAAAWSQGRSMAKFSLRMKQYKLAGRSASVAIFLGKNYLGQRDVPESPKEPANDGKALNLNNLDCDELKQFKVLLDKAMSKEGVSQTSLL
jgi:hypothetical protein